MLNLPPMGQFQEAFPELKVPGPGETRVNRFQAVRRDQMIHLARAYEVQVPEGSTAKDLRRFLDAAYERGAFAPSNLKNKRELAMAQGLPPEQWPDEPKPAEALTLRK